MQGLAWEPIHTQLHTRHHHQVSSLARSQHDIQGPFQQRLQTTKDVNMSFAVQETASEHRADGEL